MRVVFTNSAWVPVKMEDIEGPGAENPHIVYVAAKKFSDQAVLEFADEHPEMDVTSRKLLCFPPAQQR
jgi:hypothetical protein